MATAETSELITLDGGDALAAITRSEVDSQVSTAHAWPRSLAAFRDRVLSEMTIDEATAASCIYTLPARKGGGGKPIEGPSVRTAEVIAAAYGNIRVASRVISIDERFVTAQGVAHDLEANYAIAVENKRSIVKKNGQRYSQSMIQTTALAAQAIAYREAVFKVVPRALFMPAFFAAREAAIGTVETLAKRRSEVFGYFARFGVVQEQVLAVVGREQLVDVTLDDLATLRGIATAIKNGEIDPEEAFKITKPDAKVKAADDNALPKPGKKPKQTKAQKEAEPAAEAPADNTPITPEEEFEADTKTERVVTK